MSSPIPDDFTLRARQARRRAERSRRIVWLAMLAGAVLGAAFVGQSLFRQVPVAPTAQVEPVKSTVVSGGQSSFSGIDQFSKPFSVQAEDGVQDSGHENLMHLKIVRGRFVRREGGEVQINADAADYEVKTKDLKVSGHVRFEEPGRYVALLNSAEVNLDRQKIFTQDPVQVETSGATVSADTMETSEDGKIVRLQGHVHARFVTDIAEKGAQP